MFKVQYLSLLSRTWVDSHLGNFSTERRARNAAATSDTLAGYETRVVPAL